MLKVGQSLLPCDKASIFGMTLVHDFQEGPSLPNVRRDEQIVVNQSQSDVISI